MQETNGFAGDLEQDPVVVDLRKRIEDAKIEQGLLRNQLDEVTDRVSRYERAIKALTGKRVARVRQTRAPGVDRTRGPRGGKSISDEALTQVKEDIFRFAEDHEEFRQVDIRTMPGAAVSDSGKLSTAFKVLRQEDENFLRLARREGNNMYFRLTRAALQEAGR